MGRRGFRRGFGRHGFWIVLVLVLGRLGVTNVVLLLPLGATILEPDLHLELDGKRGCSRGRLLERAIGLYRLVGLRMKG